MTKEAVPLGHNDPFQGSAHLFKGDLCQLQVLSANFQGGLILGSSDFPC